MCRGGRENLCPFQHVLGVTTDGAQADHAVAPARMLVPVPGSLPFEQAAILADAVATLNEAGSIDYAREKARSLVDRSKRNLEILPDNEARSLLESIAEYLISRGY